MQSLKKTTKWITQLIHLFLLTNCYLKLTNSFLQLLCLDLQRNSIICPLPPQKSVYCSCYSTNHQKDVHAINMETSLKPNSAGMYFMYGASYPLWLASSSVVKRPCTCLASSFAVIKMSGKGTCLRWIHIRLAGSKLCGKDVKQIEQQSWTKQPVGQTQMYDM